MKHSFLRIITTAALSLAAVLVCAQNKSAGINLSLWNKISTQPVRSGQQTYFNLGIVSINNKLNGLSVNLVSNQVDGTANGMQIAGLMSVVDESVHGVQVAGLANVTGEYSDGLSLAGVVNIIGESQYGLAASGFLNMIGIDSKGIAISGLGNMMGYTSQGLAIGGIFNSTGTSLYGLGVAGLVNLSKNTYGAQISGLSNISNNQRGLSVSPFNVNLNNLYGLQLGAVNINLNKSRGLQLGLFNIASAHKGVQFGLVNFYEESLKGGQFGLINLNSNTKISVMAYGGNRTKLNLAMRFKNKVFYTILGVGSPVLDFSDKFSGAINYRAGMYLPVGKHFEVSADLGYQHINTFKNAHKVEGLAKRMYSLQSRANIEYLFNKKWSVLVSGGYEAMRWYSKSQTYRKGALIEGGLIYTIK